MSSAAVENAADASQIKADAMNANASPYSEGDKVLISSSSLLYEAKVEKSAFETKGGWKYFIHYVGWNKKYDEWVPYQRLKKYDDNAKIHKPGRGSAQKNKKKKTDDDEDYDNMVKILLPTAMKNKLVGEWEAITRDNKLIPLPKKYNVSKILAEFLDANEGREPWPEIVEGLELYFDKTLKSMLLYPQEKKQAENVLKNGKTPRKVYGVEHLIRLFVKLPEILPYTNFDEESLGTLTARLTYILAFIKDNSSAYYTEVEKYSHL
jgi:mortality factor 4-like protein 1